MRFQKERAALSTCLVKFFLVTAFTISLMIGFYFLTPIFWTLFKPLVVLLILLLLGSLIFIVMIV
ncbi:hypothetical protein D3857_07915 [Streptococcus mutans]|nr:hypothetical protein [Streptococcus mutans]